MVLIVHDRIVSILNPPNTNPNTLKNSGAQKLATKDATASTIQTNNNTELTFSISLFLLIKRNLFGIQKGRGSSLLLFLISFLYIICMSKLRKDEYIARYGENAWARELERRNEVNKLWRLNNPNWCDKEKKSNYQKQFKQTQSGRAGRLVLQYKNRDKKYGRGDCTITREWIMDKIFTSTCIYCGETDWRLLGCDRIDNNLPHTPDNCVCACQKCNSERGKIPFEEFLNIKKGAA